jgi:apolipoprotein N-acyltransferase
MKKLLVAFSPENVALAIAGGVLMRYSFGLNPVWYLAWLAPAPVLVAAVRSGRWTAMAIVSLAGLIASSANFHYYSQAMPLAIAVLVTIVQALAWTLIVCRTRRVLLEWPAIPAFFAYPLLWVAFDRLTAQFLPDGNWGSIGYSQQSFLPAAQIVAVAGMAGLAFLLALLPSALAVIAVHGVRDRSVLAMTAAALLLVGASIAYGHARLSAPTSTGTTVGLAAIDDYIGPRTPQAAAEHVWSTYEQHIAELAQKGAQVIVLPEKIAVLSPSAAAQVQRRMAAAAARSHVWLVVGIGTDDGKQRLNLAWLFSPSGSLSAQYQKHHLAPPEREFIPGHNIEVRQVGLNKVGLAICKDMHFAEMGLQYNGRGIDLMLVPAWDFGDDGQYAARISALRGIESGFAMVRSAREGLLTVTDAYGRILAETPSVPMPGATLISHVPAAGAPTPTVYSRTADVFGWLCVVLSAPVLFRWGRRGKGPKAGPVRGADVRMS